MPLPRVRVSIGLTERRTLLILAALLVGGGILAVSQISQLRDTRIGATRTTVPGSTDAALSGGRYVLYYESAGAGRNLATPQLSVTIAPVTGAAHVTIKPYGGADFLDRLGFDGRALFNVELPRAAVYRITVTGTPPAEQAGAADIVLGAPVGHKVQVLIIGGLIAVVALLVLAASFGSAITRRDRIQDPAIGD